MKKLWSILCVIMMMATALTGCGLQDNRESEAGEQLKDEIGAFEITAEQRELAADNEDNYSVLVRDGAIPTGSILGPGMHSPG